MLLEAVGATLGLATAVYLVIRLFYPWVFTDLAYLLKVLPSGFKYVRHIRERRFITEVFEGNVQRNPHSTFILYEDQKYSYSEVDIQATRTARAALSLGLHRGDTVAYMQHNCPQFMWTFLGFLKAGVRVSLINTNLRGKSLHHCLSVSCTDKFLIANDPAFITAVLEILQDLPNVTIYVQGPTEMSLPENFVSMDTLVNKQSDEPIDAYVRQGQRETDICCYIFTSGTTGLPKAAKITQKKLISPLAVLKVFGLRTDDVIYVTLPMYHTSAIIVGMGSTIMIGATCALAKKFSKTNFFPDVRRYKATVFLYIGELCRFLLSLEKSDRDKDHAIRLAIGNGLRQDIFREFKERFAIPKIFEFYASTEGSMGFLNTEDVAGSCGRCSPIIDKFAVCGLYKWDVEKECLVRDNKGHCIPVALGRPGLLLTQINKTNTFEGYRGNRDMTESKIARNVVKDGDMYFNTGDLMYKDHNYNVFFSDRVGDTFRWRGENVSTTEVGNLLSELDFVQDACVYGVHIPGHDGKAGMATLLLKSDRLEISEKELSEIAQHCQRVLPVYAVPMFLRLKWDKLELTSTMKQTKVRLKQEGFDFRVVSDSLYFFDKTSKTYRRLSKESHENILNQTIRF